MTREPRSARGQISPSTSTAMRERSYPSDPSRSASVVPSETSMTFPLTVTATQGDSMTIRMMSSR